MKRLSRHTAVVLLVAMLSCIAGMSIAVVAFGQAGGNPDAGVPAGDFTGTTPAPPRSTATTAPAAATTTEPLSSYTTSTPATTPSATTPTTTTTEKAPVSASGQAAPKSTAASPTPVASTPPAPSTVVRRGPNHLAFTGAEPLTIGGFGVALMLTGLGLGLQRRRASRLPG